MLTQIVLRDFQAHKDLTIDLGKFTTLTGGSNGGKSAVLRAISALVRNESAGDYLRYGQKSLSVKLIFSDKCAVEWIKGGGENKYILTHPDGSSQTFDKVGADVPDEVRDVLKLGPILIKGGDKEYINFHNQLESPFLISSTPGHVAKLLGELTSASKLYAAVNEGNKKVRSTNSLRTTRVRDVRSIKDDLDLFDDLDAQESALGSVKALLVSAESIESNISNIESIYKDYNSTDLDLKQTTQKIEEIKEVVSTDLSAISSLAEQVSSLQLTLDNLSETESSIDKHQVAITYLQNASTVNIDNLFKKCADLKDISNILNSIKVVSNEILSTETEIEKIGNLLHEVNTKLNDIFSNMDACPTCYQELSEEAKSRMIQGEQVHAAH